MIARENQVWLEDLHLVLGKVAHRTSAINDKFQNITVYHDISVNTVSCIFVN